MVVYLLLDTETTGLNIWENSGKIRNNHCLQFAYKIKNKKFETIEEGNYYITTTDKDLKTMNWFNKQMHQKSGVLEKALNNKLSISKEELSNKLLKQLSRYAKSNEPVVLVGNNVQFDLEVIRQNFPDLYKRIHFSVLDITSVRRAIGIIKPKYIERLEKQKCYKHNAYSDMLESEEELKKYLNFFSNQFQYS